MITDQNANALAAASHRALPYQIREVSAHVYHARTADQAEGRKEPSSKIYKSWLIKRAGVLLWCGPPFAFYSAPPAGSRFVASDARKHGLARSPGQFWRLQCAFCPFVGPRHQRYKVL
jgi:hypothetical protein